MNSDLSTPLPLFIPLCGFPAHMLLLATGEGKDGDDDCGTCALWDDEVAPTSYLFWEDRDDDDDTDDGAVVYSLADLLERAAAASACMLGEKGCGL